MNNNLPIYDDKFFDYIDIGARRSAAVVVAEFNEMLPVRSVLDVGCGRGVWLAEWIRQGVGDAHGVDGAYVAESSLAVPQERISWCEISQPFDLGRRFALIVCLEVAEHIPVEGADKLLDNLIRHGDQILFSAAVPGQGGAHHFNERPLEYWREKFAARGYSCFDPLRRRILEERKVEPWYRYNTLFYAKERAVGALPEIIGSTETVAGDPIRDVSPLIWRVRNAVLRSLPQPVVTRLALAKHAAVRAIQAKR